ncbi:MAG TPA: ATP-binding protein [Terriglobales bacterium]
MYDIADDALENQIDDVRNLIEAQKKKNASIPRLQEELTEAYVLEHSGDYLQIRDQEGDWIYRAPFLATIDLPAIDSPRLQKPLYEDLRLNHKPFRFMSEAIEVDGRLFIVQTGLPEDDTLATLVLFRRYLLLFAPFLLVISAWVGYWLSKRALAPVDALARTARDITGTTMGNRLEKLNTGDELQRLSDTLNEMLGRIENAFLRVTQFTADASHELRTPISLIRTESEIALRKSRDIPEYREALAHILSESERTSTLIEKLLSLARADAGQATLDIRDVNLRDIVLQAAEDWRQIISEHNLQFAQNISDHEICVQGDSTALHRLINILLDNAVKYTPARGSVQLSLEIGDDKAILSVRDTGIGISREDCAKIFDRFYRVDKARTRESGGAGLGLAIAEWIVEQHHGSISVESTLGAGSLFIAELPSARISNAKDIIN